MKLVIIESPYADGTFRDVARNLAYARAALLDSLSRGEAPFVSHLLYAQSGVLNDDDPEERQRGIDAGIAWASAADLVAVYLDLGLSPGMVESIRQRGEAGRAVVSRWLPPAVLVEFEALWGVDSPDGEADPKETGSEEEASAEDREDEAPAQAG